MSVSHGFLFIIQPYDNDGNVRVKTTVRSGTAGKLDLDEDEIKLLKEIAADSNGRIEVREEPK